MEAESNSGGLMNDMSKSRSANKLKLSIKVKLDGENTTILKSGDEESTSRSSKLSPENFPTNSKSKSTEKKSKRKLTSSRNIPSLESKPLTAISTSELVPTSKYQRKRIRKSNIIEDDDDKMNHDQYISSSDSNQTFRPVESKPKTSPRNNDSSTRKEVGKEMIEKKKQKVERILESPEEEEEEEEEEGQDLENEEDDEYEEHNNSEEEQEDDYLDDNENNDEEEEEEENQRETIPLRDRRGKKDDDVKHKTTETEKKNPPSKKMSRQRSQDKPIQQTQRRGSMDSEEDDIEEERLSKRNIRTLSKGLINTRSMNTTTSDPSFVPLSNIVVPSRLTARQQAMYRKEREEVETTESEIAALNSNSFSIENELLALPMSSIKRSAKQTTSEQDQWRKLEKSRKRRELAKQQNEEEKRMVVERLLGRNTKKRPNEAETDIDKKASLNGESSPPLTPITSLTSISKPRTTSTIVNSMAIRYVSNERGNFVHFPTQLVPFAEKLLYHPSRTVPIVH